VSFTTCSCLLAGEGLTTLAVELTPEAVAGADCVVIVTDHSSYDWPGCANARRVVTRAMRCGVPRRWAPGHRDRDRNGWGA
jgi:UDP-N-acetyl-D-mannosaminuronate dehydrogenase